MVTSALFADIRQMESWHHPCNAPGHRQWPVLGLALTLWHRLRYRNLFFCTFLPNAVYREGMLTNLYYACAQGRGKCRYSFKKTTGQDCWNARRRRRAPSAG